MTTNPGTGRDTASRLDMIIDRATVRKRVAKGDLVFSQRVMLTALIKGDRQTRVRILDGLCAEHFHIDVLALLFSWVREELESQDTVDIARLYQRMEADVQDHWMSASDPTFDGSEYSADEVMAGYLAPIDHVLAIDMPDAETIDYAIASLQKYRKKRLARNGKPDTS